MQAEGIPTPISLISLLLLVNSWTDPHSHREADTRHCEEGQPYPSGRPLWQ